VGTDVLNVCDFWWRKRGGMGKVAPMWLDLYIISWVSHSPSDFLLV
jgi:hypothetical protein